ncbi:hypothetical protein T440DRAFT_535980 [Plenodomus tracheiphilus IPT5]|uniref:Uncharacterized protein n=1 Tax=Plenodomus tracheiphilus IPT5 TaxID=1408161 RepID=A0A6A7BJV7_9PLEO|nr:hypothetical protein T440DRAFT_535980 [Plenodomus tracheiphilus IPT5]
MPSRSRLTLASFEIFAKRKFSKAFAKFEQMDEFTFERKRVTEGYPSGQVEMILVGRYHTQNAALPNVWAHNTEFGINYYVGLPGTLLVKLTPDPARIYFSDPPFSLMIGGKNDEVLYTAYDARRGSIPSITKWRDVVESVIIYAFLKTGRLESAYATDVRAVLDNFKTACDYFAKSTWSLRDDHHVKGKCFDTGYSSIGSMSGISYGIAKNKMSQHSTKVKVEQNDSEDDYDYEQDLDPHRTQSRHAFQGRAPTSKNTSRANQKPRSTLKSKVTTRSEYERDLATDSNNKEQELQILREGLKQEKCKVRKLKTDLMREKRKQRAVNRASLKTSQGLIGSRMQNFKTMKREEIEDEWPENRQDDSMDSDYVDSA